MGVGTLAVVGATGGAGATRLSVECAATLARAGRTVGVVDAAYATQGLSRYVRGRIDGDVTGVATGERPLEAALYELDLDVEAERDGRVVCCPAHAPFERVARAKTPAAAQQLESVIAEVGTRVDHVVLDVPPVAANQAVAALTSADQRALVAPATRRGADLLPRQQGRLRDLDAPAGHVVATRSDAPHAVDIASADVAVPTLDHTALEPTAATTDGEEVTALAEATERLFDVTLDIDVDDEGWLSRRL